MINVLGPFSLARNFASNLENFLSDISAVLTTNVQQWSAVQFQLEVVKTTANNRVLSKCYAVHILQQYSAVAIFK